MKDVFLLIEDVGCCNESR